MYVDGENVFIPLQTFGDIMSVPLVYNKETIQMTVALDETFYKEELAYEAGKTEKFSS